MKTKTYVCRKCNGEDVSVHGIYCKAQSQKHDGGCTITVGNGNFCTCADTLPMSAHSPKDGIEILAEKIKRGKVPWKLGEEEDYVSDGKRLTIIDANGNEIFGSQKYYPVVTESLFPLIVQCINERAELVAALESTLAVITAEMEDATMALPSVIKKIEKLLKGLQ